jgi:hypothetical protein
MQRLLDGWANSTWLARQHSLRCSIKKPAAGKNPAINYNNFAKVSATLSR